MNCLQLVACAIATATAFAASRRGQGLSRPFWLLIGAGLATWGMANLGWMYYENWLHSPAPRLSWVRILFDSQGAFFAMALFLDKDRDSPHFDLEMLFDSLQVVIVFFSALFGLYYVQLVSIASDATSDLFMTWIFQITNVTLTVIAGVLMVSAQTQRLRSLYRGMTVFLVINAIAAGLADYVQNVRNLNTQGEDSFVAHRRDHAGNQWAGAREAAFAAASGDARAVHVGVHLQRHRRRWHVGTRRSISAKTIPAERAHREGARGTGHLRAGAIEGAASRPAAAGFIPYFRGELFCQ